MNRANRSDQGRPRPSPPRSIRARKMSSSAAPDNGSRRVKNAARTRGDQRSAPHGASAPRKSAEAKLRRRNSRVETSGRNSKAELRALAPRRRRSKSFVDLPAAPSTPSTAELRALSLQRRRSKSYAALPAIPSTPSRAGLRSLGKARDPAEAGAIRAGRGSRQQTGAVSTPSKEARRRGESLVPTLKTNRPTPLRGSTRAPIARAPSREAIKSFQVESESDEHALISASELDRILSENRSLKQLHEIINFLGSSRSIAELRPEIVELGMQLTGLGRGLFIEGFESSEPSPRVRVRRGWASGEERSLNFKLLRRLLRQLIAKDQAYFGSNLRQDGRYAAYGSDFDLDTIIVLPLRVGGRRLGVLAFADDGPRQPMTDGRKSTLLSFAEHAAAAHERLLKLERSQQSSALSEAATPAHAPPPRDLRGAREAFYRAFLSTTLKRNKGSLTRTAAEARISRDKLIELLEFYGLIQRRRGAAASRRSA